MSQRTRGGRFTLQVALGHAFLWDQVGVLDRPDDDSKLIGVVTRSKRTTVLVVVVVVAETAAGKRTQERKALFLWFHVANTRLDEQERMTTAASLL